MIINSTDGTKAVSIIPCGGSFLCTAEMRDGQSYGGNSYWFTIGTYKTEKNAIRAAKRKMAQFGYELAA